MADQSAESTSIDWEGLLLSLHAYTRSLVNGKGWFRGGDTTTFLKGKQIEDYVMTAIGKYLRHPEKHDPSRGTLVDYLKFNLIRSMVSNDLVSAENRTSHDVFAYEDDSDTDDSSSYLDSILPYAEDFFDQEIDFQEVMQYMESAVKGDVIVQNIFIGISGIGLKRREIIKQYNMSEKEFDNGMRRLITIRDNAAKKYNIKPSTL